MLYLLSLKLHIGFSLLYISFFQYVLGYSSTSLNPVPVTTTTTLTCNPRPENYHSTTAAPSLRHLPVPSPHNPNLGHQVQVLDLRSSDFTTRDDTEPDERLNSASTTIAISVTKELFPSFDQKASSPSEAQKWHLTTYWSCVTYYDVPTTTSCGWHEPVLPGGDEISEAPGKGLWDEVRIVGVLIAAVEGAFLLRMELL